MSELDWRFVKETLADALELEPAQRSAFVHARCRQEPHLHAAVERLLRGHDSATGFLDDASPTTTLPHEPAPPFIGPYQLHETLGEGGFGVVYRATQTHPFEREVAIKLLKRGHRAAALVERFRSERDALAKMDHEDICRVFDAGLTDDGRPFVVMDLVRGQSIRSYCQEHRVGLSTRLALVRRAALAVHHAHQRAIIHCDVKPSNILIAQEAETTRLRLIDFGIARVLDDTSEDTTKSDFAGTPRYMSPERRTVAHQADIRSDVYSLGAVFNELLDDAEAAGLAGDRRLRSEARAIATKATQEDPSHRYDSAAALAADLEAARIDAPLQAIPEHSARAVRRFLRRHRLVSLFGVTALVAIVSGAIVAFHGQSQALRARDEATREARRAALVRDFLLDDMLGSLDPDVARGRDVTVVELLSRVDERMRSALADDPLLLADVAGTLARAYAHVGRDEKAITAYQLAIATREKTILDPANATLADHAQLLDWRVDLAAAMMGTVEHHVEAMSLRAKNVRDANLWLGPWHPVSLRARLVHTPQPLDVPARRAELEEILRRAPELGDDAPPVMEDASRALATMVSALGEHAYAVALLRAAVESAESRLGAAHSSAIVLRKALADALFRAGQYEEANESFDQAVARTRAVLPKDHPAMTGILSNVAGRKISMGRAAEAVELMQDVVAVVSHTEGEGSIQHISALFTLGQAYSALGQFDRAVATLDPLIAPTESQWGEQHVQTARTLVAFAVALRGTGDYDRALQVAAKVNERIGTSHDVAVTAIELRHDLLTKVSRNEEARRLVADALATLPATTDESIRRRLTALMHQDATAR